MNEIIVTEKNAHENEIHQWTADASDLRLPPGQWPVALPTTLGNKQPFIRDPRRAVEIQLESGFVRYTQVNGCLRLSVFND